MDKDKGKDRDEHKKGIWLAFVTISMLYQETTTNPIFHDNISASKDKISKQERLKGCWQDFCRGS